jgi:cell division protein FtsB
MPERIWATETIHRTAWSHAETSGTEYVRADLATHAVKEVCSHLEQKARELDEAHGEIAELEGENNRHRKTMTGDAMHRHLAEQCRDEIQLALPGWNWQDPVRDTLHSHPIEQIVNVALRRLRTENDQLRERIAFLEKVAEQLADGTRVVEITKENQNEYSRGYRYVGEDAIVVEGVATCGADCCPDAAAYLLEKEKQA